MHSLQAIRHIHTLATSEAPMAKNQGKQALIYLHILVRMVPRVMEFFSPEELRETFLKTSEIGKTVVFIMDAQGGGQALVEAKVDSGTPNGAPTKKEKTILLIQFVEALTGLFFKPGFTFPANQTSKQPNILPIWAGPRIKPPSSEHMVYRLSVLEGMLTVMYLAEYFGKELGLDYLGFYMSSRETAQPGFCQSFLLSLVQTGLKLRENGVFPYLSHLYTQETETRVSVLSLTLFAKFITREHHVDYIKGHIRTDPLLNLMRLSLSEGFATSQVV